MGKSPVYPPYLFTYLDAFLGRCHQAARILLLMDYDGTLTPIAPHPDRARLSRSARARLKSLASLPTIHLGIISGRKLSDLEKKIRLPDVIRAGNHGLEILFPSRKKPWIHPGARRTQKLMSHLATNLQSIVSRFPGGYLENKGLTLSVHYRMVQSHSTAALLRAVRATLAPYLRSSLLKACEGKKVIEVRPPIQWDKGNTVRYIYQKEIREKKKNPHSADRSVTIYIGDDQTDEDAFRVLKNQKTQVSKTSLLAGNEFGIRVGKTKHTRASFYVQDPGEVMVLLKMIEISIQ